MFSPQEDNAYMRVAPDSDDDKGKGVDELPEYSGSGLADGLRRTHRAADLA